MRSPYIEEQTLKNDTFLPILEGSGVSEGLTNYSNPNNLGRLGFDPATSILEVAFGSNSLCELADISD